MPGRDTLGRDILNFFFIIILTGTTYSKSLFLIHTLTIFGKEMCFVIYILEHNIKIVTWGSASSKQKSFQLSKYAIFIFPIEVLVATIYAFKFHQ